VSVAPGRGDGETEDGDLQKDFLDVAPKATYLSDGEGEQAVADGYVFLMIKPQ
jgi:hypothetical protein